MTWMRDKRRWPLGNLVDCGIIALIVGKKADPRRAPSLDRAGPLDLARRSSRFARRTLALSAMAVALVSCLPGIRATRQLDAGRSQPLGFTSGQQGQGEQPQDAVFSVSEHGPTGVVPHENIEGGVWVLFSRPVVSLRKLEKPSGSSKVMSITPPLEGTFRWYGSRLLGFEPKGSLAPATEYTVAVSSGLTALDGRKLEGERSFTFRTEPLSIVSASPSGDDVAPEECREIVLIFSSPVDLKLITPSIRLEAEGNEVPFKAGRPVVKDKRALAPYNDIGRFVSLSPDFELPRDTEVTVRVLKGARPQPGTYGTAEDLLGTFHTLRPLEIVSSELWPAPNAILEFNHPIREDSAAPNIHVEVPDYSVADNIEVAGDRVWLGRIPVPFESSFTVRVMPGLQDVYGQSLGREEAVAFEVGQAPSYVWFRGAGDRILEAAYPPIVAVEMQNVLSGRYRMQGLAWPNAPGNLQLDRSMDLDRVPRNSRHFELFDLSPLMGPRGTGAAFLSWEVSGRFWESEKPETERESLLVQVTDMGATLALGWNRLVARVASLASGVPVADAEVSLRSRGTGAVLASAPTTADGTAAVELAAGLLSALASREEDLEVVIARQDDRLVLRPAEIVSRTWNTSEPFAAEQPRPVVHLWSDRGIYRPGDTVSFAGEARTLRLGAYEPATGRWLVELDRGGSAGEPVATVEGTLSPNGTFSGTLEVPASAEPDDYWLSFRRELRTGGRRSWDEQSGYAALKVAFFREVSFSVDLTLDPLRAFAGEKLSGVFAGSYLAGGSVTRGSYLWWWNRREIWYQPPGEALSSYSFGYADRTWAEDLGSSEGELGGGGGVTATQEIADTMKGRVYSYELTATVEDVDRQAISKQASALAFASELQLGGKLTKEAKSDDSLYFVTKGKPFSLKVVGVDPDGKPYPPAEVAVRLVRQQWKLIREKAIGRMTDTRWESEEVIEKTASVKTGGSPVAVQLSTEKSGSYLIELESKDRKGRDAYTRFEFYATGSDEVLWQRWDERQIEIVPDKKLYKPGDKARLLIKSPVAKGAYVVTVEREGILEQRTVELSGGTPIVEVDVTDAHVPVFYVFVATAGGRTAPPPSEPDLPDLAMPSGASGVVEIPVETQSRRIELAITSSKGSYLPGTEASLTVTATRGGKPLEGAEIALVAADRGVLDLIDYHVSDPLSTFYASWLFPDRVAHFESRDLLLTPVTWKARDIPGGDDGKGEKAEAPGGAAGSYLQRRNFVPTPLFRTGLVTGRDGKVTVAFRLPDQLTRFRTTAVAVKGDLFGIGEDELLVQNPINVRAALPRRMRVGDAATAGVVLTSLQREPTEVTVSLSANLLAVKGEARKTVKLSPGSTTEVAFDLSAPSAGSATLTFTIDSDALKEKLEQKLAVEESRVFESFTIIGKTSDRLEEGLVVPGQSLGAPTEGLELTLDSTIASGLAGAVTFLELYPYDCLEQRTSKLFAWLLFPYLAAEKGITGERLGSELAALSRFSNADGGYAYWDSAPRRSDYYVSLRLAHLLADARAEGISIPRAIDVEALLSYLSSNWDRPYPWEDDFSYLKSYALYVLTLHGRRERVRADALLRAGDSLGLFGYGFLGLAYDQLGDRERAGAILERLKGFMRVGTRSVTLAGSIHDAYWYGGNVQAKALLLMLYGRLAPDSQLVQALANDLLENDRSGHWGNTSSAGWVLQAFNEMMRQGRETESDFTASVSLGAQRIAEREFQGLSREPFVKSLSPAELSAVASREQGKAVEGGKLLPLAFAVQGPGTLYYTAMYRYALEASAVEPRDEGIGLAYEILDQDGKAIAGTDLALGKVYTMRITVYSSRDRSFLALRAPIPSGVETIDSSLAATQIVKPAQGGGEQELPDWWGPGYTTQIYDNEVRFHFDRFARGRQEVSFAFRATTPGAYPTPPVQAELMYEPEVFGRAAGAVWRIAK